MEIGVQGKTELAVTDALLASTIGSGLVRVYATPMMIAGIENTAASSVQPLLEEGKTTVGTRIDVTHEAATPCGMKVRFETELVQVSPNGRALTFKVAAYDEAGLIGQGTHERVVVSTERFEQKAQEKLR